MRALTALRLIPFALTAVAAACANDATTNPVTTASAALATRRAEFEEGAVYTMTNAASGNAIVALRRTADGELTPLASYPTGGAGTGGTIDPLASQYSLVLNDDHRLLFAVNAGSNSITSFRVGEGGELSGSRVAASNGTRPVSLAVHGDLLYVLDAGSSSVAGYRIGSSGELAALPGSGASLPAGAAGAAAIRFTRDGRYLVVTERGANRIDVFDVRANGRLGEPRSFASHGRAAFGFDVTPANDIIVSETAANAPNGGVSAYRLANGLLSLVTGSVPSGGPAACWLLNTSDGKFSYVINAGGASIGAFAVNGDGSIAPIASGALTSTGAGSTPLDPAFSAGDRFLYVLEGGSGDVAGFAVGATGALIPVGTAHAGAAASGLQGLAAF